MPFIAECTFCQGKVRVPDTAAGLGISCPRCGNFFTLAATTSVSAATPREIKKAAKKKAAAPLAAMTGPTTPAVLAAQAARHVSPPAEEDHVEAVLAEDQPRPTLPALPVAESPASSRAGYLDPLGVVSFLLGSSALLLAQLSAVDFLSIPLGIAGGIVGLFAVVLALDGPRRRLIFPVGGTLVSLIVLTSLCFWPSLLALSDRASKEVVEDLDGQSKVRLDGKRRHQRLPVREDEWVDAGEYSFEHGDVRVQVVSATVEAAARKEKDQAKEKRLVIVLRLLNTLGRRKIVYRGWGGDHPPVLCDQRGKQLPAVEAGTTSIRDMELRPGQVVHVALAFEAPSERFDHGRLALPASALGRTGTLRLHIPGRLVQFP
jgi:hypothetical protein